MPRLVHKIDRLNRSDDLVGNTYHSAWLIRHLFLLPVELIDIQLPNGNILRPLLATSLRHVLFTTNECEKADTRVADTHIVIDKTRYVYRQMENEIVQSEGNHNYYSSRHSTYDRSP